MNCRICLLLCLLFFVVPLTAQKIVISKFELSPYDATAAGMSTQKKDLNGEICALIKIRSAISNFEVKSTFLIHVEKMGVNEFYAYLSPGTLRMEVHAEGFIPATINFAEYGMEEGLASKCTYILELERPKTNIGLSENKTVATTGEATFTYPEWMSTRQAETRALWMAQENAVIEALGGNGDWIEMTKDPSFSKGTYKDGRRWVSCKVEGTVRKASSFIDFKAKILRNGTDEDSEANEFVDGDKLYMYFKSQSKGYLAVFLHVPHEEKVFRILPYPEDENGIASVEAKKEHVFFTEDQMKSIEALTLWTNQADGEVNFFYILFSPNRFSITDDSIDEKDQNLRCIEFDTFDKWQSNCLKRDKDMRVVKKMITIRSNNK